MRALPVTDAGPAVRQRRKRGLTDRLGRSDLALDLLATLLAAGLRFIHATSRISYEPRSNEAVFADLAPFIATSWHGQAFMLPMLRPPAYPADVLASRASDGELIARTLVRLGCGVIRGSGAPNPSRMFEKGAVAGFRGMRNALAEGRTVGLTADFLRNARRKVSPGIVVLARVSGRPIVPLAFASSRRREIASWDRTTIALPFGRAVCVFADPVWVPADADDALLEARRLAVETALEAASKRAYQIADRRPESARG